MIQRLLDLEQLLGMLLQRAEGVVLLCHLGHHRRALLIRVSGLEA